jgi:DnaJ-class molecular chaperone
MSDKQIDYNCPSCGGNGYRWIGFFNHYTVTTKCPWCKGTGKYRQKDDAKKFDNKAGK